MKISYNWLKQYTNFDLNPVELAEVLTDTGLEVEGIEEFESIKGALEGIYVGEVLECIPHPDADRLSLTKVDVGDGDILSIVCGAPNVAKGQKVAVAIPGTTLYSDSESFTIKKTKIRGQVSMGMICAEDELGIGNDHEGIVVLQPEASPGQALSEIISVEKDTVLEIGLTPNRIDGACHIGTARDIVAFLNLDHQKSVLNKPDVSEFAPDNNNLDIQVEIDNNEACIRYSGVSISDIEVKESPDWLKNRLKAIGLNPINNIVDISNYVLHETGQPLHAFDADKITGNKVIVKTLPEGTSFVTLDEEKRKLSSRDLMICNSEEGMCIAGVFGGYTSGVSSSTKNIFLESACFDAVYVRTTAKRHGLSTDSSFRFERGTDPNGTIYALKRAALLIKEIAGGKISSEIKDIYPVEIKPYPVTLKWANLNRLIGIEIPRETVVQILALLDINVVQRTSEEIKLEVATYRVDVTREADIIEEVLRIYGYNNIGISEKVNSTLSYAPNPDPELFENRIAEQLVAQGFNEIMANSLTKTAYYSELPGFNLDNVVELVNPLSNDLKAMRRTLLYGGLESVRLNQNHRRLNLRLFEFGNTYELKNPEKSFAVEGYEEVRRLSILLTGSKTSENWKVKQESSNFYQLKAFALGILSRLGLKEEDLTSKYISNDLLQEGLQYSINDKEVLFMGQVNQKTISYFEIDQNVYYGDINWTNILGLIDSKIRYKELPKYPEVRRDLALVVDKSTTFDEIKDLAFQVEKRFLQSVNLFDVFESEKLGPGKKSYAISFTLLDDRKTLTDKQIDKIMKALISAFDKKLGAELR